MELKIIGSSGALPFPKPGCRCKDCNKAQENGIPYKRISSSLFIKPDILIDTPEECFRQLMDFRIFDLKHVFYTHWHPDHTQGNRIFELWTRSGYLGKKNKPPIKVYLPNDMLPDFKRYLPGLWYYESMGFLEFVIVKDRKPLCFGNLMITPVNFNREDRIRYGYLIEEKEKRVMYAPCSIYEAKLDSYYENLDILMVETGFPGDEKQLRKDKTEPWLLDHISLNENFVLQKKIKPKVMILTHLCASTHATYDSTVKEAKKHKNALVAYDGMEFII